MKNTDKDIWFVACVPLHFKKMKGIVETTDGCRYVRTGMMFKCLVDDIRKLELKFICLSIPERLFRRATKKELQNLIKK